MRRRELTTRIRPGADNKGNCLQCYEQWSEQHECVEGYWLNRIEKVRRVKR